MRKLIFISFMLLVSFSPFILAGETSQREQFFQLENLIKLVETAREAGFDDEAIKKLSLKDHEKSVNVMEYIANLRHRANIKSRKIQDFINKQFLTPQDIFNELLTMEPDQLIELREELVSE